MFFNMLSASTASRNEVDTTTTMFEPGSKVGDTGKYVNAIPYTGSGSFSEKDWYIIDMNEEFLFDGTVGGCLAIFYEHCIIFK